MEVITLRHYTEDYKIQHNIKNEEESQPVTESRPVEPENRDEKKFIYLKKLVKTNRIANFRLEPDQSSDVIDVLIPGTKLEVIGAVRDLYKVKYGDREGFIKKLNVDEVRE